MDLQLAESDVLALLDEDTRSEIERLGPAISWNAAGAALASTRAASGVHGVPLWDRLVAEFRDFLCTDSKAYADLRREWDALRQRSTAVAVTALTAALATELGVASTIVAPLVIWLLLAAIRMGGRAFCRAS